MSELYDFGILIVDDSETILTILRRLLKKAGFKNLKTALNASQALKFIKDADATFAVILSDQNMPGVDGIELFEKVIQISPDTRRLLMTGYKNPKAALKAINIGSIHRYIQKPWDDNDLISLLTLEMEQFNKIQERHQLNRITQSQTKRLFKLAKSINERAKAYQEEIKAKQELKSRLKQELKTVNSDRYHEEKQLGLENLFKKNNVLQSESLSSTFNLLQSKILQIFRSVAESKMISVKDPQKLDWKGEIDESHYPVIDKMIEYACRLSEDKLALIGIETSLNTDIDHYTQVPDVVGLAHSEGYLTDQSLLEVMEIVDKSNKKADQHFLQTLLRENDFISRKDLSKVVVKQKLIEIRLNDRILAEKLIAHELVSEQEIQLAFASQISKFEAHFHPVSILDILADLGVIEKSKVLEELNFQKDTLANNEFVEHNLEDVSSDLLPEEIKFRISEDKMTMWLSIPQHLKNETNSEEILDHVKKMGVRSNIVGENLLSGFLNYSKESDGKFVLATGVAPQPGKSAIAEYSFDPDYQQAGIVLEDGTIDFRDRGSIPHVKEGDLLVKKIPMVEGKPGYDIFGEAISVEDVEDLVLNAGKGTVLSESGLEIYAALDGRPNLDQLGTVSVFKELMINSDVGYETGHIEFPGNVIITGCVKDGFHVKCVGLTVKEINGGIIHIDGDLNVSTGIINAHIKARGNIQAKYINHSQVECFGDITVTQEILETDIITAGEVLNAGGLVTASKICAKKGMVLNHVGTDKSKHSILRVGIDDYQDLLKKDFDKQLSEFDSEINKLKKEKEMYEKQNLDFHKNVIDLSFEQEQLGHQLNALKDQYLKLDKNLSNLIENRQESQQVKQKIDGFDEKIKAIFLQQDELNIKNEAIDRAIEIKIEQYDDLNLEQGAMKEIAQLDPGNPFVKINGRIVAGNIIQGPTHSMTLRKSIGNCTILELSSTESDGPDGKKIVIQ